MRIMDVAACRLTMVASDFEGDRLPVGWLPVAERAIVTFTRTDEPVIES
jgi:glutamine amidotransferase